MRNKIIMFALMCALLLSLVPTTNARADDIVDVESLCMEACLKLIENDEIMERIQTYKHYAVGYGYDSNRVEIIIYENVGSEPNCLLLKGTGVYLSQGSNLCEGVLYYYADGVWNWSGRGGVNIGYNALTTAYIVASSFDSIVGYELLNPIPDIYTYTSGYAFPLWCTDAGLNCQASSNESDMVIPYSYNDYWHIVRKTNNGKWLLTTIGNSVMAENIADYRLYIGDNGNLHVASIYGGENANGYKLNVRQYEYDVDGWKLRTYETFDTREYSGIVDLGAGSGFDGARLLAYTNVDIFVGAEYEPTYSKSTEYYEVTTTPPTEEPEEPIITPTTNPSNPGSTSVGLTYTIKADNTPVHDSYWKDFSEVIGYLNIGDKIQVVGSKEIVGEIEPWYQVRADVNGQTVEGWVYGAYINIESDLTFNGTDGLMDALNVVIGLISSVPLMIGAVFGFLPQWCIVILGASFAFMGVYLVVKIIRG